MNNRRPAWARKGRSVSGMTIDDALTYAGIDYEVKAAPAVALVKEEIVDGFHMDHVREIANTQFTYRADNIEILGIVGKRYHVVQTKTVTNVIEELVGGGWEPEFAGAVRGGKAVFMVGRLPFPTSSEVEPYLAFVNSFDGSTGIRFANTPIRPACTNAIRRTFRSAKATFTLRHTQNIGNRVEEARKALGLANAYYRRLDDEIETFLSVEMDAHRLNDALEAVYPMPKPRGDEVSERQRNHVMEIRGAVLSNLASSPTIPGDHRGTGWGFINAVSEHEQWLSASNRKSDEKRAEDLLCLHLGVSVGTTRTDRAFQFIDQLVGA